MTDHLDQGKELRLAIAMGGGVSLGSFSGAAVTEALKLSVLEGVASGRYSRVRVDVFSGASAGAVSLILLLRTLAHRTAEQTELAQARLGSEPGWRDLPEELRVPVIAAEVSQQTQRSLWVEELKLDLLLGDPRGDLRYQSGIFNRHAIDHLAERHVAFDCVPEQRLKNTALLADRVLFACTLSNLTPMVADATQDLPGSDVGFAGLMDAMSSGIHQEIRVFDLHFNEIPESELPPCGQAVEASADRWPARWMRFHTGPVRANRLGDLRTDEAWAVMTSTAIAAAAFPIAFEPVVLTRRSFEYGEDWPAELCDPSFETGKGDAENPDYEYPFTYFDGGIFNNEPLREAFKLAAYLDASDDPDSYVRRVIYIDPVVGTSPRTYALDAHRAYHVESAGWLGLAGKRTHRSPTLARLTSLAPRLIQTVVNEAKVNEGNRAASMRLLLEEREGLQHLVRSMVIGDPGTHLRDIAERCRRILDAKRRRQMIPPGPVTLAGALRQTLHTIENTELDPEQSDEVLGAIVRGDAVEQPDEWLHALTILAFNLIADIEAKRLDAKVVAIAPIRNPEAERLNDIDLFDLPGAEYMGFAGFMSTRAARHDFEVGRWCAHNYLRLCDIIGVDAVPPPARVADEDAAHIARALRKGSRRLARRLSRAIGHRLSFESRLFALFAPLFLIVPPLRTGALARLIQSVPQYVRGTYEFHITVPGRFYALEGPDTIHTKIRAVEKVSGERRKLVTVASLNGRGWEGIHVSRGAFQIVQRRFPFFMQRTLDPLALPDEAMVERAHTLANPVFAFDIEDPAKGWRLLPGVQPLDRRLLRTDD